MAEAAPEIVYAPGACNIGRDEVKQRRGFGWIGVAIAAALAAILYIVGAAFWLFIIVAAPVFLAAIGFIQAEEQFCVRYAAESRFNVGAGIGHTEKVGDEADHAADMAKAKSMNLRAGAIALGVAIVLGAISAVVS